MKLESLKSGKFAAQTLSPEMMRLVSGGITKETTYKTGAADTSKYSKCGASGEFYDMQVSLNATGELVIQGMSTEMWKGTDASWYK